VAPKLTHNGTQIERPRAIRVARQLVDLIEDTTDQLVVAGSLRRRLALVSDIEIVAVPKRETVELPLTELFSDEQRAEAVDLLNLRMTRLLADNVVTQRLDVNGTPRWGPTLKYLWFDGDGCGPVRFDLFAPSAERLGWILMLRTGPAAFSRQLVVERGKKTRDGRPGLLPLHLLPRGGWLTERASAYQIATRTERDVFDLFKLRYREPWERT
jgi:DNA polymerase/3'-5' exonuclease PolX